MISGLRNLYPSGGVRQTINDKIKKHIMQNVRRETMLWGKKKSRMLGMLVMGSEISILSDIMLDLLSR